MTTYALIHAAGGSGWDWHLLEAELRARGHRTVAPDLPADDESATLRDYAAAVVDAVGDTEDLVVVAHSFGAFTAPLVADLVLTVGIVLVAGMVPSPGEPPAEWWTNTGYATTADESSLDIYYHDVPEEVSAEALRRERAHPSTAAYTQPWPLKRWPDVPTRFVLCTEDRVFPADFLRKVADDRLGVTPEELASGHCPAFAHPQELARLIVGDTFR